MNYQQKRILKAFLAYFALFAVPTLTGILFFSQAAPTHEIRAFIVGFVMMATILILTFSKFRI